MLRNRHVRTTVRTYIRRIRAALSERNLTRAEELYKTVSSVVDRAVSKGVYHRRTGSRYISRIATQLSALKTG